jgi:Matrixin
MRAARMMGCHDREWNGAGRAVTVLGLSLAWCVAITAQSTGPRALDTSSPIGTFIADGDQSERYKPADRQLAQWAFDAWQRATRPTLQLMPVPEASARVRLYWAGPQSGQYGEMRSLRVNGQVGAAVYIRPDTTSLGPDIHALATSDPLFRDTVVYLTCVHELGHAFGLQHTADFRDIMYSFQYGGDFVEYFRRYRRQLTSRDDIARTSGMSDGDIARVRTLYPAAR